MKPNQTIIFSNLQIYTEDAVLKNASLIVQNGVIQAIEPTKKISAENCITFPENYHLVPGFIDLHVHGANGSDVMDANREALATISRTLAAEGTTGFLATTMTAAPSQIEKTLVNVREFMSSQHKIDGAEILGVHLEGPFLSPQKIGAQSAATLLAPNVEHIERWQELSKNVIKLVTLAPELSNSLELIKYLKKKNIIASIGHTDATYAETKSAIAAGCSYATHLFNAMRGLHQREPGAVTAALLADEVMAELIVDGVHLHPAIVELALKLKGKNKIVLVTDSMRAKCMKDGKFELGGQVVEVKNTIPRLQDGTLAGSVLKMSSSVRNLLTYSGCGLLDAVKMAAENPAKVLGIFERKGSIALNKDADLVVLDNQLEVVLTLRGGTKIFAKTSELTEKIG